MEFFSGYHPWSLGTTAIFKNYIERTNLLLTQYSALHSMDWKVISIKSESKLIPLKIISHLLNLMDAIA